MLKICLLGSFEFRGPGGRIAELPSHKCKSLLSMLLLRSDQLLTRSTVVGALWGDLPESQARRCLSSELWRVRHTLCELGINPDSVLETNNQAIGVKKTRLSSIWLDVRVFREKYASCSSTDLPLNEKMQRDMEHCIELYRGDLLEGTFDDWYWLERETLRNKYHDLIRRLLAHHKIQCRWNSVIDYGQRLLAFDPLLEDVHRDIMRAHLAMDNRSAALRQFETCAQGLQEELGADPMPETMTLFRNISAAPVSLPCNIRSHESNENQLPTTGVILEQALQHLSAAEELLNVVRNQQSN